jgi:hypothetical protein
MLDLVVYLLFELYILPNILNTYEKDVFLEIQGFFNL